MLQREINGTVAGGKESVGSFKEFLSDFDAEFGAGNDQQASAGKSTLNATDTEHTLQLEATAHAGWYFKDSTSERNPFVRFKVKIRSEIVTTGFDKRHPASDRINALSPAEWHAMLNSEEDYELIDVRNYYETELGIFRGATDPGLLHFRHFGEYIDQAEIPKEKKVLMYCTGGIRCEKAIFEMIDRGYADVAQLKGGILDYLQEFPDGAFEGECFVFDKRVAVTPELQPSETYRLCVHCGQPGSVEIQCSRCEAAAKVCARCKEKPVEASTCSKNCAYHARRQDAGQGERA